MKDGVLRGGSFVGMFAVFVLSLFLIGCSQRIKPIEGASGIGSEPSSEISGRRPPAPPEAGGGLKDSIAEERVPSDDAFPQREGAVPGGEGSGDDPFIMADRDASSGGGAMGDGDEGVDSLQDAYFEFDQWVLQPEARSVLEKNVRWLERHPEARIRVEGHCDVRGTHEYNLALGERRAKAAINFMVNMGIDRSRVSFISFGEEKNTCSEKNDSCYKKNRRAHFVVLQK